MGNRLNRAQGDVDYDENRGINEFENGLPVNLDVIEHIFSFLSLQDKLNCVLVCKQWKDIVENCLKRNCIVLKRRVPAFYTSEDDQLSALFYAIVLSKNPFDRNLVLNPYGEDEYQHWRVNVGREHRAGSAGWVVENPPAGCDPLPPHPELEGAGGCFSTTFFWNTKEQTVDLEAEGWDRKFLDTQPPLRFVDWIAPRFDCGCKYKVEVVLLSTSRRNLGSSELTKWTKEITKAQWAAPEWERVEHIFTDYGRGLRYVNIKHSGKDTQFWAGNYGIKISGTSLRYAGELAKLDAET